MNCAFMSYASYGKNSHLCNCNVLRCFMLDSIPWLVHPPGGSPRGNRSVFLYVGMVIGYNELLQMDTLSTKIVG